MLRSAGFDVETFGAQQFLEKEIYEGTSCLLLDVRMPGLTGIEVAKKISGKCQVVFITAYDQYAIEAFENEAVDYLLKPIDSKRLKKPLNAFKNV